MVIEDRKGIRIATGRGFQGRLTRERFDRILIKWLDQ